MQSPELENIIVVKVGTTTLFRHEQGREVLDVESFERVGQQVLSLVNNSTHVAIVSSGAVTAGMEVTQTAQRPTGDEAMPEIQRLAVLGWPRVVNEWKAAINQRLVGPILLTRRELNLDTPEHDEALRTTYTLMKHGDIPVLNENDAITHTELSHQSFGQNDTLAAIYAAQIARSGLFSKNVRLVLLSDVDGVYQNIDDPTSLIPKIANLKQFAHLAGEPVSKHGTGGMKTKFDAARIALSEGVEMWVANGRTENAIERALSGEIGTHFAKL